MAEARRRIRRAAERPLFVLEGEKSAQDIESFDEGTLRIPPDAPQPGDIVKVGQILAFLVEKGEAAAVLRSWPVGSRRRRNRKRPRKSLSARWKTVG